MPMIATRELHHLNAILSEVPSRQDYTPPLFPGAPLFPKEPLGFDLLPGFNYSAVQEAKHTALSAIAARENPFMLRGLSAIEELPTGEYTGEQVRMRLTRDRITPDHPNAWGALISSAVRHGALVETGRYVPMECLSSHGRKTQIYTHSKV